MSRLLGPKNLRLLGYFDAKGKPPEHKQSKTVELLKKN